VGTGDALRPPQKLISAQAHPNEMKLSGYVVTRKGRLPKNLQPEIFRFQGDMSQTRVKNDSFGIPNFSVLVHSIYYYFSCWKEHLKLQGMTVPFF